MMGWLAARFGVKAAKIIFYGAIVLVLLFILVTLARCHHNDTPAKQAEQTTRSGEAQANASAAAIGTIENRHDADANGDAATIATQGNIANAQTPDAIHSAVIAGVCRKASHRNDPACK